MASTWAGPPFMATVSAGRLWTDDASDEASDEASSCSGWEDAAFSSSDAALEAGWLSGLLSASETAEDAEEAEEAGLLSAADWAGWPLPQAASCKTSAAARHPARIFFNLNSSFSFHYPVCFFYTNTNTPAGQPLQPGQTPQKSSSFCTEALCFPCLPGPGRLKLEVPEILILAASHNSMVFSGDSSSITFLLAASSKTSQPIGRVSIG